MFKYYAHESKNWPTSSIKWLEINPKSYETQVKDFDSALEYLEEEWRVYDCDGGNTFNHYVAINDGTLTKYFEVEHEFWAVWEPEFFVENFFNRKEITKEEAHIPDDRDWLDISKYNYKLKGWPKND